MRKPRIAITTYHREPEGRPRVSVPTSYIDAVRVAGGVPILLPPDADDPAAGIDIADGLLLTGGGDIDPIHFGGSQGHPNQYLTCAERDCFELALVAAALERSLPLLAICRGMQILNVALGGDLHVHLPDVVGESVAHRYSQDEHTYHPVRLDAESRLGALLGGAPLEVASWHHQGVARVGRRLRAVAWAEDGTIEAVEAEDAPHVLAVQWHPELQIEPQSPHLALFSELVRRARGA